MDITVKVKDVRQGEFKSSTVLSGIKNKSSPKIQEYIKDNKHHYIDVFFGSVEDSQQVTYDELFNP
jgi:hypothetical protein